MSSSGSSGVGGGSSSKNQIHIYCFTDLSKMRRQLGVGEGQKIVVDPITGKVIQIS